VRSAGTPGRRNALQESWDAALASVRADEAPE
jgi:hypothetical protein